MIKMSEAMRLGAMLHPQSFSVGWQYAEGNTNTYAEPISTCALGAAAKAVGIYPTISFETAITDGRSIPNALTLRLPVEWDGILGMTTNCPVCSERKPLIQIISHLNDTHRWTREAIADIVEGIENPLGEFPSEKKVEKNL